MNSEKQYTQVFKALGDMTRLRITHLLLEIKKELCVCEIVDSLGESQSNISRHLKELKYAGLVCERKDGKWTFYSVVEPEDQFTKNLLRTVASIKGGIFKKDLEVLKLRLTLRQDGKCAVGMNSEKWKKLYEQNKHKWEEKQ